MIKLQHAALFFDFDGTLAEIAARPDEVWVAQTTKLVLQRLNVATGGAVAIVTGREIGVIDGFLSPLRLPVAGVHGLVRRDSQGHMHDAPIDREALVALDTHLSKFAAATPGVILERKSGAVALHYRQRPDAASAALDAVQTAIRGMDCFQVVPGKMVLEVKSTGASKGSAVRAFLLEPPFHGRVPFFAGDDVTDEDAFSVVNELGGISVKIGAGNTAAGQRMENPAALAAWLSALLSEQETPYEQS